jgi:uncharacterized membrane protein YheB (UPF0754 family)
MNISFLIGPIIGGIIGLITNGIAIRMLFRPLKPVMIFGHQLPFTPGLIPKEKPRIAKSLGNVVANTLVNETVIKKGLLSPEMDHKISLALEKRIDSKKNSDETLRDFLYSFTGEDEGQALTIKTQSKITKLSYGRVSKLQLGERLSEVAIVEMVENLQGSMFSMLINDSLIASAKIKIAEIIDHIVVSKGEEIIEGIIATETTSILDQKLSDLYNQYKHRLPEAQAWLLTTYHNLIEKNSGTVVRALNIAQLVEEQINSFDILTFEKIILDIMSKELKAIVWLGGLLGCIMGLVMTLIN